jgi:hypothetical protein
MKGVIKPHFRPLELHWLCPLCDVVIVTYAVRRVDRREFRVSREHRKFGVFAIGELPDLAMPGGYRVCAARRGC